MAITWDQTSGRLGCCLLCLGNANTIPGMRCKHIMALVSFPTYVEYLFLLVVLLVILRLDSNLPNDGFRLRLLDIN